jgi:hypothetical protein
MWVLVASLVGNVCTTTQQVEKLVDAAQLVLLQLHLAVAVQMVVSLTTSTPMDLRTTQDSPVAAVRTKIAVGAMQETPEQVALLSRAAMDPATAVVAVAELRLLVLTVWTAQLAALVFPAQLLVRHCITAAAAVVALIRTTSHQALAVLVAAVTARAITRRAVNQAWTVAEAVAVALHPMVAHGATAVWVAQVSSF